ncbi:Aste57867_3415 [Aphanomyces stellatus]|uniref:Aste57867_3415 protein n=1 Tax=Aphanomyces stellatus TaxID=120398 RepID=A0A485K9L3_9STRA|nr:hypothetical protein As57867_003405 [Aphanomyces stellatus]VFT80581.1 Aste57867_3415 [Aphanomyces stellatus]
MTMGVGTCRWMAPEILLNSRYTDAVDVFSFGVVLSELDTHNVPYTDLRSENGNPLSDTAILGLVMQKQLRPTFSATCPGWLVALASECMAQEPTQRPKMSEVAYLLRTRVRQMGQAKEAFV